MTYKFIDAISWLWGVPCLIFVLHSLVMAQQNIADRKVVEEQAGYARKWFTYGLLAWAWLIARWM